MKFYNMNSYYDRFMSGMLIKRSILCESLKERGTVKKLAGFVYNTSSVHDKMVVKVVKKERFFPFFTTC
ncbi:hypothetical protein ACFFHM_21950 [Halalkalibacter kiskunsagensis]|uniref:Uncharacterized protein n=1 Tax=Halalkalibacter kiskunsagensis TaxID=1548599 RepID=A0ABV6KJK2_9BACI